MDYRGRFVIVVGQDKRVGDWVCKRTGGSGFVEGVAIGYERHGELVAGVIVDHYNKASACLHVAGTGKYWLTREFLRFVFGYVFEQLRLNVILGFVPSWNTQALRFDQHLGFIEQCRIPAAVPHGDLVILAMRREQCRYLGSFAHGRKILATSSP